MDHKLWMRFLSEMSKLQMFSLSNDFDVEDNTVVSEDDTSSSSSSLIKVEPSSSVVPFHRLSRGITWSQSIIDQLRAPYVDPPNNKMELFHSEGIDMSLGLRFFPGQNRFINTNFKLPYSFDRLSNLSESLGLSYYRRPLSAYNLASYSHSGPGLLDLLNKGLKKVLLDVITIYEGRFGRFLVLVILGVGCTVWYGFAPYDPDIPPLGGIYKHFDTYDSFMNLNHYEPVFSRVGFVERTDVSGLVEKSFSEERPFEDIMIPATAKGPLLNGVRLGVMIAIFLSVGLFPNSSGDMNVEL